MTCELSPALKKAQQEVRHSQEKIAYRDWKPTKQTFGALEECGRIRKPAGAPPAPAGGTPPEGRTPNESSQISTEIDRKPQIPLDIASYKLYYVNYEIGLNSHPRHTPAGAISAPPSLLLLVRGFAWLLLSELVVDVLLEKMRIGAHNAPPIHEDRWCAVHLELLAVCAAGIDGRAGFRAGHAALEYIGVQSGLACVIHHFRPGVRCPGMAFFVISDNKPRKVNLQSLLT